MPTEKEEGSKTKRNECEKLQVIHRGSYREYERKIYGNIKIKRRKQQKIKEKRPFIKKNTVQKGYEKIVRNGIKLFFCCFYQVQSFCFDRYMLDYKIYVQKDHSQVFVQDTQKIELCFYEILFEPNFKYVNTFKYVSEDYEKKTFHR